MCSEEKTHVSTHICPTKSSVISRVVVLVAAVDDGNPHPQRTNRRHPHLVQRTTYPGYYIYDGLSSEAPISENFPPPPPPVPYHPMPGSTSSSVLVVPLTALWLTDWRGRFPPPPSLCLLVSLHRQLYPLASPCPVLGNDFPRLRPGGCGCVRDRNCSHVLHSTTEIAPLRERFTLLYHYSDSNVTGESVDCGECST